MFLLVDHLNLSQFVYFLWAAKSRSSAAGQTGAKRFFLNKPHCEAASDLSLVEIYLRSEEYTFLVKSNFRFIPISQWRQESGGFAPSNTDLELAWTVFGQYFRFTQLFQKCL